MAEMSRFLIVRAKWASRSRARFLQLHGTRIGHPESREQFLLKPCRGRVRPSGTSGTKTIGPAEGHAATLPNARTIKSAV